ncbi:MAG TPA: hypothetical protein VGM03_24715 [Phycisphaerae bacterium]|jgi:hypothetical protein
MAIVKTDPAEWQNVNVLLIDSDAPNNDRAILEIEDWAAEHGFVRVNEYWLREIRRDGHKLFRGICYRLTEDAIRTEQESWREIKEAVASMPATTHTARNDR